MRRGPCRRRGFIRALDLAPLAGVKNQTPSSSQQDIQTAIHPVDVVGGDLQRSPLSPWPGFASCFAFCSPVRRQGTAGIHRLFELPAFVAPHIALVGPGIDEFALRLRPCEWNGRDRLGLLFVAANNLHNKSVLPLRGMVQHCCWPEAESGGREVARDRCPES